MKRSDFYYQLPDSLIARYPLSERSASRLLCLNKNTGALHHKHYEDVLDLIHEGDLLVFNNTRVIPARLYGSRQSGGKVEVMIERLIDQHRCLAHLKMSNKAKPGLEIFFADGASMQVIEKKQDVFELQANGELPLLDLLQQQGHMPLPPYIDREDEALDRERYQTVYASRAGAVAAPTAGLHFTESLLDKLKTKGVKSTEVTLHVGAGTFQPVRVDDIRDHQMHAEYIEVPQSVCDLVRETKSQGGRVIAVGTTSVRCLETAAQKGKLTDYQGDTDIFIFPGYEFKVIDGLLTNFHLPESTLIMLVAALAGKDAVLNAYNEAVKQQYRFFSYGDAMFIHP